LNPEPELSPFRRPIIDDDFFLADAAGISRQKRK